MVSRRPSMVEELFWTRALRIGYLIPRAMFDDDVLRDIGVERYDLRSIVLASDDVTTLGEEHGDRVDRADLFSILCFAGYLCPSLCDYFTDFVGNDT